ncbi:MAG: hypothetical protein IIB44_00075 [Candidatus Marinimicrobia bacterium]|nr:hypothetical protein [Candidatus Neomarinimicrobiota bacterium]MCH8067646.1 hypothetical protein [Candidatus Neomarinimicrobiota bacterium]
MANKIIKTTTLTEVEVFHLKLALSMEYGAWRIACPVAKDDRIGDCTWE